ncbi:MAG: tRNA (adenosine(37)-N6)-dimethylallyltransferase MiaA [Firmicutes bacterium]|nr:tRNA (adenosine(37)-N6)-dimethylallyltransferase MiaA [Bacillota bacterium]
MNRIICVCGPTAVGKTKYAIELAKAVSGEVVSADSMQLYKFMDLGSAKPTAEEQAEVPHHLVDFVDPRDGFSVAEYQKCAKEAIADIFSRGKTPVISGGTGLYISSLIYDMDFGSAPKDDEFRQSLTELAKEKGGEHLLEMLREVDPAAAERIHPNNVKKIIRAIEVATGTGKGIPAFEESFKPTGDYGYLLIGLMRDREELYARIDKRVDILVEMGLEKEIRGLLNMGLTADDISMKGIGYKEIIGYFNGEYDFDEAVRLVKRNTRHYAKRQMTWLRRYKEMHWVNLSELSEDAAVSTVISLATDGNQ